MLFRTASPSWQASSKCLTAMSITSFFARNKSISTCKRFRSFSMVNPFVTGCLESPSVIRGGLTAHSKSRYTAPNAETTAGGFCSPVSGSVKLSDFGLTAFFMPKLLSMGGSRRGAARLASAATSLQTRLVTTRPSFAARGWFVNRTGIYSFHDHSYFRHSQVRQQAEKCWCSCSTSRGGSAGNRRSVRGFRSGDQVRPQFSDGRGQSRPHQVDGRPIHGANWLNGRDSHQALGLNPTPYGENQNLVALSEKESYSCPQVFEITKGQADIRSRKTSGFFSPVFGRDEGSGNAPYLACPRISTSRPPIKFEILMRGYKPRQGVSEMANNALAVFNFQSHEVRIVKQGDEPWFCAQDVMSSLEYAKSSNPSRVLAHVPDEWKGVKQIHTHGGEQSALFLSEQGLYFFVGRSDKRKAIPFQKWVFGEVLPSIRKTGGYGERTIQQTVSSLTNQLKDGSFPASLLEPLVSVYHAKTNSGLRVTYSQLADVQKELMKLHRQIDRMAMLPSDLGEIVIKPSEIPNHSNIGS